MMKSRSTVERTLPVVASREEERPDEPPPLLGATSALPVVAGAHHLPTAVAGGFYYPTNRGRRRPRSSAATRAFRRQHYPGVPDAEWNDWRWQLRHRARTLEEFERMLELSPAEHLALKRGGSLLPAAVTPSYMSLQ